MQTVKSLTPESLTPESLTAVEILEGIDKVHRDHALGMLRNFASLEFAFRCKTASTFFAQVLQ